MSYYLSVSQSQNSVKIFHVIDQLQKENQFINYVLDSLEYYIHQGKLLCIWNKL